MRSLRQAITKTVAVKMRKADYDMYNYDNIEIKPNCLESFRELERINLDKEKEDGNKG